LKEHRRGQYFGNISLKFNLKAGGIKYILESARLGIVGEGKTVLVSLDVIHPSPGSRLDAPSDVGIVASIDSVLGRRPGALTFQEGGQAMFLSCLRVWEKKNK
jgi:eukaryotic translation initiation factor 2C